MITIIAVHGNGGGGFRFSRCAPCFSREFRFLAPTLPGFAGAPLPPHWRSLAPFAMHLGELVERQPRPRMLLGHGIGGSVALELLQRRVAVDGVILHAPVGAWLDRRLFPKLMRPRWIRRLGRAVFASRPARPLLRRLLFRNPELPRAYTDRFFEEYRRAAAFGLMFDCITPAWFASLRPVSIPGALLWGGRERVLDPGQRAAFRHLLPGAVERVMPEWDHFPMADRPEEYARVVSELTREVLCPVG